MLNTIQNITQTSSIEHVRSEFKLDFMSWYGLVFSPIVEVLPGHDMVA